MAQRETYNLPDRYTTLDVTFPIDIQLLMYPDVTFPIDIQPLMYPEIEDVRGGGRSREEKRLGTSLRMYLCLKMSS